MHRPTLQKNGGQYVIRVGKSKDLLITVRTAHRRESIHARAAVCGSSSCNLVFQNEIISGAQCRLIRLELQPKLAPENAWNTMSWVLKSEQIAC